MSDLLRGLKGALWTRIADIGCGERQSPGRNGETDKENATLRQDL